MTVQAINITVNFDIKKYGNQLYQHFLKQADINQGTGKKSHTRMSAYTVNNINTIACLMVGRDYGKCGLTYTKCPTLKNALPTSIQDTEFVTRLIKAKIRQMLKLGLIEAYYHTSIWSLTALGDEVLDDFYAAVGMSEASETEFKAYLFTFIREVFNTTGKVKCQYPTSNEAYFVAIRAFYLYIEHFKHIIESDDSNVICFLQGSLRSIVWLFWNIGFEPNPSYTSSPAKVKYDEQSISE